MVKKGILACCFFQLVANTAAHAQSSVVLYGNVASGVAFFNNVDGAKKYAFDDGTFIPNLFGFLGHESLGGGLETVFRLEANMYLGNGNLTVPGQIFTRQAYVGIESKSFGRLTLGHQTDLNFDFLGPLSNGQSMPMLYAFHPGNFDELANTYQYDNSIKYLSPDYRGLTVGALIGLSNRPGDTWGSSNRGIGVQYKLDNLTLAASYTHERNRFLEFGAFVGLPELLGTPVTPDLNLSADSVTSWGAGGAYKIGSLTLQGLYTQTRVSGNGQVQRGQNVDLAALWRIAPVNAINSSLGWSRFGDGRWLTLSVGDVYSLSKRTNVYLMGLYQIASGNGATASMLGAGQASGKQQAGVVAGIQHFF